MIHEDLRKTRVEAVLVVNGALQPVEVHEVHTDSNGDVDISAIVLSGERARYISGRFRDQMRSAYGMVAKNPFLYDVKTPSIKKVIFNDPATIVIWSDDSKTVVKCQPGDTYSKELGLAMCISKKFLGNKGNFNEVFKKWISEDEESSLDEAPNKDLSIEEMREVIKKYCGDRRCDSCIIHNLPNHKSTHCYGIATDEEVVENYNAIKHLIKED